MKDTKERILAKGLNLVTIVGFDKVTVGVLAQETGMSKSGLFAHFGSKEEVQLGLLDELARVTNASIVEPALLYPPGLERLRAIMNRWFGWTTKAGLEGGCPGAAGFFEYDDLPTDNPVRQRLLSIDEMWRTFLLATTREAVESGELRTDLDLEQFVWELVGLYFNHHVSYRFCRDPRANDRAHQALEGLITRSLRSQKKAYTKVSKSENPIEEGSSAGPKNK